MNRPSRRTDAACLAIGHRVGPLVTVGDTVIDRCPRCGRDVNEQNALWRVHQTLKAVVGSRGATMRELAWMTALILALSLFVVATAAPRSPWGLLWLPAAFVALASLVFWTEWGNSHPRAVAERAQIDAEFAAFQQRVAHRHDAETAIAERRARSARRAALRGAPRP